MRTSILSLGAVIALFVASCGSKPEPSGDTVGEQTIRQQKIREQFDAALQTRDFETASLALDRMSTAGAAADELARMKRELGRAFMARIDVETVLSGKSAFAPGMPPDSGCEKSEERFLSKRPIDARRALALLSSSDPENARAAAYELGDLKRYDELGGPRSIDRVRLLVRAGARDEALAAADVLAKSSSDPEERCGAALITGRLHEERAEYAAARIAYEAARNAVVLANCARAAHARLDALEGAIDGQALPMTKVRGTLHTGGIATAVALVAEPPDGFGAMLHVSPADWRAIDTVFAVSASVDHDGDFEITVPRGDWMLTVVVAAPDARITPCWQTIHANRDVIDTPPIMIERVRPRVE